MSYNLLTNIVYDVQLIVPVSTVKSFIFQQKPLVYSNALGTHDRHSSPGFAPGPQSSQAPVSEQCVHQSCVQIRLCGWWRRKGPWLVIQFWGQRGYAWALLSQVREWGSDSKWCLQRQWHTEWGREGAPCVEGVRLLTNSSKIYYKTLSH